VGALKGAAGDIGALHSAINKRAGLHRTALQMHLHHLAIFKIDSLALRKAKVG
jgi:hypothetical protein